MRSATRHPVETGQANRRRIRWERRGSTSSTMSGLCGGNPTLEDAYPHVDVKANRPGPTRVEVLCESISASQCPQTRCGRAR